MTKIVFAALFSAAVVMGYGLSFANADDLPDCAWVQHANHTQTFACPAP